MCKKTLILLVMFFSVRSGLCAGAAEEEGVIANINRFFPHAACENVMVQLVQDDLKHVSVLWNLDGVKSGMSNEPAWYVLGSFFQWGVDENGRLLNRNFVNVRLDNMFRDLADCLPAGKNVSYDGCGGSHLTAEHAGDLYSGERAQRDPLEKGPRTGGYRRVWCVVQESAQDPFCAYGALRVSVPGLNLALMGTPVQPNLKDDLLAPKDSLWHACRTTLYGVWKWHAV